MPVVGASVIVGRASGLKGRLSQRAAWALPERLGAKPQARTDPEQRHTNQYRA